MMNENVNQTNLNKARMFGKDITDQMKLNKIKQNQNQQNAFKKEVHKVHKNNRLKTMSMDEQILKKTLNMANNFHKNAINEAKENVNVFSNKCSVMNEKDKIRDKESGGKKGSERDNKDNKDSKDSKDSKVNLNLSVNANSMFNTNANANTNFIFNSKRNKNNFNNSTINNRLNINTTNEPSNYYNHSFYQMPSTTRSSCLNQNKASVNYNNNVVVNKNPNAKFGNKYDQFDINKSIKFENNLPIFNNNKANKIGSNIGNNLIANNIKEINLIDTDKEVSFSQNNFPTLNHCETEADLHSIKKIPDRYVDESVVIPDNEDIHWKGDCFKKYIQMYLNIFNPLRKRSFALRLTSVIH